MLETPSDERSSQLRAARAMLGWSLVEASQRSRMSISTVYRLENNLGVDAENGGLRALQDTYAEFGVVLTRFDRDTYGVLKRVKPGSQGLAL